MSVEIPALASKIATAKIEAEVRQISQNPPVTELPNNLYRGKQLERYQRTNELIGEVVRTVAQEAGIVHYQLERDFSWAKKHLTTKGVDFKIKFSNKTTDEIDFSKDEHNRVLLHYDPGGRFNGESINLRGYLTVPNKERNRGWFSLEDAVSFSSSPDATAYTFGSIGTFDINAENLADMIRIGIAGAKTVKP